MSPPTKTKRSNTSPLSFSTGAWALTTVLSGCGGYGPNEASNSSTTTDSVLADGFETWLGSDSVFQHLAGEPQGTAWSREGFWYRRGIPGSSAFTHRGSSVPLEPGDYTVEFTFSTEYHHPSRYLVIIQVYDVLADKEVTRRYVYSNEIGRVTSVSPIRFTADESSVFDFRIWLNDQPDLTHHRTTLRPTTSCDGLSYFDCPTGDRCVNPDNGQTLFPEQGDYTSVGICVSSTEGSHINCQDNSDCAPDAPICASGYGCQDGGPGDICYGDSFCAEGFSCGPDFCEQAR